MRLPGYLINFVVLVGATAIGLAATEAFLRLVPNRYARLYDSEISAPARVAYSALEGGLYTLSPNQQNVLHKTCVGSVSVDVNRQGFRDATWAKEKGSSTRILALGDSFIEALQVEKRQRVTEQLAGLVKAEVMNAGVSGYSTITELAAYEQILRGYKPDLVLLFFYLGNDISGNSCGLSRNHQLCAELDEGRMVIKSTRQDDGLARRDTSNQVSRGKEVPNRLSWLKDFAKRHLVLYQALHDLKILVQGVLTKGDEGVTLRWQLYLEHAPPSLTDAWRLTALALDRLKQEVAQDGGHLALVTIPEYFTLVPDWKGAVAYGGGISVPGDFDKDRPAKRLMHIAETLGIPALDLTDAFQTHRDRHQLEAPYFSFDCDGHWNTLAHDLAAKEIAAFLQDKNLYPAP